MTCVFAFAGLERTDNGMKQTSWPDVMPINQKNYYTYVPQLAWISLFLTAPAAQ
jgi:hypothetical protein